MKKVYHQCRYEEIKAGPAKECSTCAYGKATPKPVYRAQKPKYTWETARLQIDFCDCGAAIPEDHPHHKCEKCEPEWRKRIALLDRLHQEANPWEYEVEE